MRFALLGADPDSLALAEAAAAVGHAVVWRDDAHATADPTAWEALLDDQTCDAVIVGADGATPDARARQVQELAKLGRPLLTVHPVVPSVISYFEIDMARSDGGAVIQHYNPLAHAPAARRLESSTPGNPRLDATEQIVATRYVSDRSRQRVLWHFTRDVELLARLAGRLNRIGAHAATDDADAAYASLSVQLIGPDQIPARWAVEPPTDDVALRVTLIGASGRTELAFDASDGVIRLLERGPSGESSPHQVEAAPARAVIERFAAAVAANDPTASTWPAALDAMELADSIELSLRRGRMIDVHHRELTEQLAFKGVMSAAGCGVLVVLVPLMLMVGWVAGLFGIPLSHYWPHVLLAFLAAFLAVQLLPKFIAGPSRASASPPGSQTKSTTPPDDSAD